jgi:hypothetical protein
VIARGFASDHNRKFLRTLQVYVDRAQPRLQVRDKLKGQGFGLVGPLALASWAYAAVMGNGNPTLNQPVERVWRLFSVEGNLRLAASFL